MQVATEAITSFRGQYKFLSNFSFSPFKAEPYGTGVILQWRTVEHYYQASKADSFEVCKKICNARSPRHAKHMGRQITLREDWDKELGLEVMLAGLRYKFAIPMLQEKLLATDDLPLIEGNTWGDRYWGMVEIPGNEGHWIGENHLGILLMQVREELQNG